MKAHQYLLQSLTVAGLLCAASIASAQCTITSQILSGDGATPGSQLRVRVAVTSNASGFDPDGVAFRVTWPTNSLTWGYDPPGPTPVATTEPGDLGTAYAGPADEPGPSGFVFRDVATVGVNSAASPATPVCFTLNFTVGATPVFPYTLEVADDPGNPGDPPGTTKPVAYLSIFPPAVGSIAPRTYANLSFSPDISLPGSSSAGSVQVGSTGNATATISNSGNVPLTVTGLAIDDNSEPAGTFTIVSPATPFTVAAGGTQNVTVQFAPTSTGTFSTATLDVTSNSPGETFGSIPLAGVGIAGDISVPASASGGSVQVGSNNNVIVPVTNSGAGVLTVSGLSITNNTVPAGTFTIVSPPTPFALPSGDSQDVTVLFAPASPGTFSTATLDVASDSPGETSSNVPLSGIGIAGDISVPASLDFPGTSTAATSDLTVTIDNVGGGLLTLGSYSINLNGDPAGTFTLVSPPTPPVMIPSLSSTTLTVRFDPASTILYNSADLVIGSDSFGEPSVIVPLSGQGVSGIGEWNLLD